MVYKTKVIILEKTTKLKEDRVQVYLMIFIKTFTLRHRLRKIKTFGSYYTRSDSTVSVSNKIKKFFNVLLKNSWLTMILIVEHL